MFACLLILVIPSYSGLFISFSSDFFSFFVQVLMFTLFHMFARHTSTFMVSFHSAVQIYIHTYRAAGGSMCLLCMCMLSHMGAITDV